MWKKIKAHKEWLFILLGIVLIVFATFKLEDVYTFTFLQNLGAPAEVDQEGFASILVPESDGPTPEYLQLRTTPADIPDWILIEKIGLDAPVLIAESIKINIDGKEVIQFLVPEEFAAGWHEKSAPLGEVGNTVISGHHNAFGKVFEKLVSLNKGAEVVLKSGEKTFTYEVVRILNLKEKDEPLDVRLENARWIMPSDDERITLVTCWPKFSNTNRIIIVAIPVDNEQD
jgi:LPXTG-site transpeptidase (sortase) family protein